MNNGRKLLLLVLLVKPISGFGQQQPGASFDSLVAAAQQAQAANDFAAAVNDYKQAVRIQPGMPELWANLGLMEQQAGDTAGALQSFLHANHLNPSLYVPNLFAGIDYAHTGRAPEAISFLTKAELLNKTDPQAPLALGRAYYAMGKFSTAAQQLGRAVALDPKLGAAWFDLGIARLNQVELDARKMSEEWKTSPFAGALYAESLEKQARFNEAATLYRSLLDAHPQPPCLHSALGFALLRHRDPEGAAAEFAAERTAHPECGLAVLGQARIALSHGDRQQAAQLLQELWQRDEGFFSGNATLLIEGMSNDEASAVVDSFSQPETVIPADFRHDLLAALNRSEQPLDDQHDSLARREPGSAARPTQSSAVRRTAEEYYAAGEFAHCAQRVDPALAAGRADQLRLLAACAFFTGDNERAFRAGTALEALEPHSAEGMYWSIQADERLAVQSLARFQQLESDSPRSHVLLGDIYHQLEREDDAQAEYQKALTLEPGYPAAMLGLSLSYLSNNDIDKAVETARTALVRSPEDPELNMVVAEAMVSRTQFSEAEPYLIKSLNVKPQLLGHVHALLGKVYAETGRTNEAISQLKMGESSDENGSIHYLLARLYRETGDTKDAAAALERVKTIKQQNRDRGVKAIEDPDLTSLESPAAEPSAP